MRLYNLYMERDGRKVPIGTFVSVSECFSLNDLPSPPRGVRYLDPEEVTNSDAYAVAIRRYEEIARASASDEARAAESTAAALRRRLHELQLGVRH